MNNSRSRVESRRESARVRQQERDKRPDVDQLTELSLRGHGHCKEAKRLFEKMQVQVQEKLAGMRG